MSKKRLFDDVASNIETILKYSHFNRDLIGEALKGLITTISGNEFFYGKTTSYYEAEVDGVSGFEYKEIVETAYIVVKRSEYKDWYNSDGANYLDYLVQNGDAICFRSFPIDIPFIDCNGNLNSRHIDINCTVFDYVERFIKDLVQYCFENDIEYAKEENIKTFMDKFLAEYEQQIPQNPVLKLTKETKGKGEN